MTQSFWFFGSRLTIVADQTTTEGTAETGDETLVMLGDLLHTSAQVQ
jgi:hypothetical protein